MKKRACLLAAAFSIFLGIEAYGGQFIKDETGLWYQNADGTWPVGWFQSDTGSWYCFDENGYARTGWYEENGIRYYLGITDGRLFTDCTSSVTPVSASSFRTLEALITSGFPSGVSAVVRAIFIKEMLQGPVSPGAPGGHRQQEPGGDGGPQPVRGAAGFR